MEKGPRVFIQETRKTFKTCLMPLEKLVLVTVLPAQILLVVFHGLMGAPGGDLIADFTYSAVFIGAAFLTVINIYMTVLFASAFHIMLGKGMKKCHYRDAILAGQKSFGRLMWGYTVSVLFVVSGFVLFLVPGLYFLMSLLYVPPLIVNEQMRVRDAVRTSMRLINPRFWKTVRNILPVIFMWVAYVGLRLLVPGIIYLTGIMDALIVDFLMIISFVYAYRMYLDARASVNVK